MPDFKSAGRIEMEVLEAVMSTVYYFDIFKHPLRAHELVQLSHNRAVSREELSRALDFLVSNSYLKEKDGYYLPHSGFEYISRRTNGAVLAEKYWNIAQKKSRFISRFPFVRSVLISGSLSKGFMDENSDIDYLIITKPGRLWMARTLLAMYKKIFLLNSHKFFCINYFLDMNHLILNDRNLFTATELLFAKPLFNAALYSEMLKANPWAGQFYPAMYQEVADGVKPEPPANRLKQAIEKLLSGKPGDLLETICMKISNHFWKIKFSKMNREQFRRDMKSDKGVSKHHPNGFRDRILNEHQRKLEFFSNKALLHPELHKKNTQPVFNS